MRFAIIGAGVMGGLVGAMLTKAGADVWLVNRNEAITNTIRTQGLTITHQGQTETVPVQAVLSPREIKQPVDVLIFLVKGCDTAAAAIAAQDLATPRTYVMTLQNGLGNVELLAQSFDRAKILYGILELAGRMLEPGHILSLAGANSKICFGPATKIIEPGHQTIAAYFGKNGIKVILREDIDNEVWIKLRNNSTNVLFGLLRLSMGQALETEGTAALIQKVRNEVMAVAQVKGIHFSPEELGTNQGNTPIYPELYDHLPSTALDMKLKKTTEVEFINGAIYREGLRLGVPTPYNELLYRMVKIYETTYSKQF